MFIPREAQKQLIYSLTQPYISAIVGPRQCGKTMLIKHLINHLKEQNIPDKAILSINFDHPEMRARFLASPSNFISFIEQSFGQTMENFSEKKYIFIDEAQKLPAIFDVLKIIHDEYQEKIKLVISGSSSLNLYQQSAETLVGRVHFFHVSSFSWSELSSHYLSRQSEHSLISAVASGNFESENYLSLQRPLFNMQNEVKLLWNKYILFGGLPGIFLMEKDEQKFLALRDYISIYLEKDIRALKAIGDADSFLTALYFFLQNDGQLINISSLSQAIGIQRATINKYLRVLIDTFLLSQIPPLTLKIKQSVKSNKLYFFDHGIVNYEKKIYSMEQLENSGQLGSAIESIIINNTFKHFANSATPPDIIFWRDYQDHEIDLVIKRGQSIMPIEITAGNKVAGNKLGNFKSFFFSHPEIKTGYIIYGGDYNVINLADKKIFCLPHWMWW